MAKTVEYDRFWEIIFPHLCVGCLTPVPHGEIWITTGRGVGKSVVGVLEHEPGESVAKPHGIYDAGPIGGAAQLVGSESFAGRNIVTAFMIPICGECMSVLSPEEKRQLDEAAVKKTGAPIPSSTRNRFFSCTTNGNTISLTLENEVVAKALLVLNPDIVFEQGTMNKTAPEGTEATKYEAYNQIFNRDLSTVERKIIDSWMTHLGEELEIFTYPGIPDKKLTHAKAKFAMEFDYSQEVILGLLDDSDFGSAKRGMLFTTRNIYWRDCNSNTGRLCLTNVDVAEVEHKSGLLGKQISLGEHKIVLSRTNEEVLKAIENFIKEAALLMRCEESVR